MQPSAFAKDLVSRKEVDRIPPLHAFAGLNRTAHTSREIDREKVGTDFMVKLMQYLRLRSAMTIECV